jgi:uncharacterized protein
MKRVTPLVLEELSLSATSSLALFKTLAYNFPMKHQKIKVHSYPSGDELHINVYTYESKKPGPTIYMQANVHGSELQGNALIKEVRAHLEKNKFAGKWILVPQANPLGANAKSIHFTNGRIHHQTGENYNRTYFDLSQNIPYEKFKKLKESQVPAAFKKYLQEELDRQIEKQKAYGLSYCQNLAYILQGMAIEADMVFDLHTDTRSEDYFYAGHYLKDRAKKLNFPLGIFMPQKFGGAMDEASFIPWIKLYEEIGFECPYFSSTLELGNEEAYCPQKGQEQAQIVINFIEGKAKAIKQEQFDLKKLKTYNCQTSGHVEYLLKPMEKFKKGETLCRLHTQNDKLEIKALNAGRVLNISPSSNAHFGMCLYQVLEY